MDFEYTTKGTCSSEILFQLDDDHTIHNVHFIGGCKGNLSGIGKLVEGMRAEDVVSRVKGTTCGSKPTSCPDQLARALEAALADLSDGR
jgi:uncharacterized protein (TIGR03905 family)